MRIKRIEAHNVADGLRRLREELGDHALILHTKTVVSGGMAGFFRKPRVEILGAVDEPGLINTGRTAAVALAEPPRVVPRETGVTPGWADAASRAREAAPRESGVTPAWAGEAPRESPPRPPSPAVAQPEPPIARPERLLRSEPAMAWAAALAEPPAGAEASRPTPRPEPAVEAPRVEIAAPAAAADPRILIADRLRKFRAANPTLPLTEAARAGAAGLARSPISYAACPWDRLADRARRIAFVGPTGAGKTTTLAKVAARAQLERNRRVQLITIDTYRIGAVPQLASYAEILGVPLTVAHTPEELFRAVHEARDADLVFIDTIGRSPLGDGVAGLLPFMEAADADDVCFVASATTRPADALHAARTFAALNPNRLCVTKLDETDDHSTVPELSAATGLPLTWLGTGQDVPDDLEDAEPARVSALAGRVA